MVSLLCSLIIYLNKNIDESDIRYLSCIYIDSFSKQFFKISTKYMSCVSVQWRFLTVYSLPDKCS